MRFGVITPTLISARIRHDQGGCPAQVPWPLLRPTVDLRAMIDVENVHDAAALVDAVDDAISAAPGTMTTGQRPEQRLAYPVRADRKCGLAKLQYRSGNTFRKPFGHRSPSSGLEPDLVPLRACHHPLAARRRARSLRTVA